MGNIANKTAGIVFRQVTLKSLAMSVLIATCMISRQASAATEREIGIGFAYSPEFPASDKNDLIPIASFEWRTDDFILRSRGSGLQLDLFTTPALDIGPMIRYNPGRDNPDPDDYPAVSRLESVEPAIELGAFVGLAYPIIQRENGPPTLVSAGINALQAIDSHEGYILQASLGFIQPAARWRLIGNVSLNYASKKYNQAFFGVSEEAAAASGLNAFEVAGDWMQTAASLIYSYNLDERWSVTGISQVSRFTGDVLDSPVVQTGSKEGIFAGVIVSYQLY